MAARTALPERHPTVPPALQHRCRGNDRTCACSKGADGTLGSTRPHEPSAKPWYYFQFPRHLASTRDPCGQVELDTLHHAADLSQHAFATFSTRQGRPQQQDRRVMRLPDEAAVEAKVSLHPPCSRYSRLRNRVACGSAARPRQRVVGCSGGGAARMTATASPTSSAVAGRLGMTDRTCTCCAAQSGRAARAYPSLTQTLAAGREPSPRLGPGAALLRNGDRQSSGTARLGSHQNYTR